MAVLSPSSSASSCKMHSSVTTRLRVVAQRIETKGWDDASKKKASASLEQQFVQLGRSISVPSEARTWTSSTQQHHLPSLQPITVPTEGERMWELVETIRAKFRALQDGDISVSAYDTAWVARVPALDGTNSPQFPKCLDWIKANQLEDGSWGDRDLFLAYDRICGTLACVIALKTWNTGDKIVRKGLEFIRGAMPRLEIEDSTHMPIGFEIVFPAMVEEAKELKLDMDYNAPALKMIEAERKKKLQRIPMEVVENHPTSLLHSLEGLHTMVNWDKVIRFQCPDGSLLYSPASTACALMHTRNKKCLDYLSNLLKKFNSGTPNVYPVDLFERLWMVDRLERLGIARYFTREIKTALVYVHKYYTDKGIAWAREAPVQDLDDTSMAFRLLRGHGFDVSADVFKNFQDGESFFSFAGQAGEAVTGMFNLYRASQVRFQGEEVLEKASRYSRRFLEEKRRKNQLYDKWIISKDLPGEVKYGLDYPLNASLERLGTRTYIDQYAADDVWIGKTLYRMASVNNQAFLDLAKADFNMCQRLHRKEFQQLERWYQESSFSLSKFSHKKLVQTFFSAAATIHEPELAPARIIWSQSWFMASVLKDYFETQGSMQELREFVAAVKRWDPLSVEGCSAEVTKLFQDLHKAVQSHSKQGFLYQGRNICFELRRLWEDWASCLLQKTAWRVSGYVPTMEEYVGASALDIEPAVGSAMYFVGEKIDDNDIKGCVTFRESMNTVVTIMQDIQNHKRDFSISCVDVYMRENPGKTEEEGLVALETMAEERTQSLYYDTVRSDELPAACKELFLDAVRVMSFFQASEKQDSFRAQDTLSLSEHVQRVLFQPVM